MRFVIIAITAVLITASAVMAASLAGPDADPVFEVLGGGDARGALRVMDSVSRAQAAPGWVRAQGLRVLGDYQFTRGDYKKAADFYRQASAFDNSSMYRHLLALSLAADGQVEAARGIWVAIAEDRADALNAEAAWMLLQVGGQQAVSVNQQAAPVNQQSAPVAEDKPAATISRQTALADNKPAAPPVAENKPAAAPPVSNQQASSTIFTIQVGAFGSRDNADNLVKKLTGTYSDITISPAASGDQTLYRVRVGSFNNKDDATAFAGKLAEAGMTARVVEK